MRDLNGLKSDFKIKFKIKISSRIQDAACRKHDHHGIIKLEAIVLKARVRIRVQN